MPIGKCDYESWRQRADQLVRKMGSDTGLGVGAAWSPPTDVFETANGVVVLMELPGVRREDLSIVLVDDRLVVKGCRTDPDAGRKIQYHQMEIAYGAFAKVVLLRMHYDGDEITARLADGYLSLTIPRADEPGAKKIAVEVRL